VKSSPDFPLTISIEDSFTEHRGTLDWQGILREIEILTNSLLRRLEIELVDGGELEAMKNDSRGTTIPRKWQRYPSQIRLTIRTGHSFEIAYNANRESRSALLPVPVFDLAVPRVERAQALIRQPLSGLAKTILDKGADRALKTTERYQISIINIAVTHLQSTTPTRSIDAFFSEPSSGEPWMRSSLPSHAAKEAGSPSVLKRSRSIHGSDLDLDMLRELPTDIRNEVLRDYGIDLADMDDPKPPRKQSKVDTPPAQTQHRPRDADYGQAPVSFGIVSDLKRMTSPLAPTSDDVGSSSEDEDAQAGMKLCSLCGTVVFDWSMDAHMAYHDES